MSVKEILQNPVKKYLEYHKRIQKYGANAPFPEFKDAVNTLLESLTGDEFSQIIKAHPDLDYELKEVLTQIAHVNLKFEFEDEEAYPYPHPFSDPFPYRPTIDAIESALRLLDKLNRLQPGNNAVPLYHFDRYAYHRHSLIADPEVIVFPTTADLNIYDLIRVRSVPIGFVGVVPNTIRVDRHFQSPLDFWYHDINHVRRMWGYIKNRSKLKKIETEGEKTLFYKEMDDFIAHNIMPHIALSQTIENDEITAIKKLTGLIIFEILHESALTAEPEVILDEILRASQKQPFEHMVEKAKPSAHDNIENLRTPTGNIKSGISTLENNQETVTIRFFFDRALSLLSNVYNKLNFGFYDDPENPIDEISPVEYRKAEHILAATKNVLSILGCTDIPTDEDLLELISSRKGSEEKFIYKAIETEENAKQFTTDPSSKEYLVPLIKGRTAGKKIITLFGYSAREYENKKLLLDTMREDLSKYNPKEYCVCIGATHEGVGGGYSIAKELGFETIGVVSTQALAYSGKFSENVDSIYIVNDEFWGGVAPGTDKPTPTTDVFLQISDVVYIYGGGLNTVAFIKFASKLDIPMRFLAFDSNTEIAQKNKVLSIQSEAESAWKELTLNR
jgi:hypothetical protein